MPRMYDNHSGESWSNDSREWVSSPNTAKAELKWDKDKRKFTGAVQLWSCDPPVELEMDYTEKKSIVIDRWIVYLNFIHDWNNALDWQANEAVAKACGKNTYRLKGWCIVHPMLYDVFFYEMIEDVEDPQTIRMPIEDFGGCSYYYDYDKNQFDRFVKCCHICLP